MKKFRIQKYLRIFSLLLLFGFLSISIFTFVPRVFASSDFTATNVTFDPTTGRLEWDYTGANLTTSIASTQIKDPTNSVYYWQPLANNPGECTSSHCFAMVGPYASDNGVTTVKIRMSGLASQDLNYPLPLPTTNTPQNAIAGGWTNVGETWTYASADTPTFTATASGNLTGVYTPGMRIRLTQSSTIKYFLITGISYSSPNTTITLYGGTDYTLANSTISTVYFSAQKAPVGFSLDPNKWTVEVTDNTFIGTTNPTYGTWYNALQINIPIGIWDTSYQAAVVGYGTTGLIHALATLSTANNSESDADLTAVGITYSAGGGTVGVGYSVNRTKVLSVSSKTPYYLNYQAGTSNAAQVGIYGSSSKTIIRATSSYL